MDRRREREREREKEQERQRELERQRRKRIIRQREARRKKVVRQRILLVLLAVAAIFTVRGVSSCNSKKAVKAEAEAKKKEEAKKSEEQKKKSEEKKKKSEKEKADKQAEMEALQSEVESMVAEYDGDWGVYIQELDYGTEVLVNDEQMYPASLIKLYVMAATYANMDDVLENTTNYLGDTKKAKAQIKKLLQEMIEVSDNEAYNELIKLQSPSRNFAEGCTAVNKWLKANGYEHTEVHTTLHPAYSKFESDERGDNVSCVSDCGRLLSQIYKGMCVSQEASGNMLHLLLKQENKVKIPEGMPKGTKVANKTGETSDVQHDAAIVYGENTDFVLCIMTKDFKGAGSLFADIHDLCGNVYDKLNDTGAAPAEED